MIEILTGNPAFLWLAFGAALMAFEALTAPGLGLFLAGLGAICAGLLVEAGVIDAANTAAQFAWFFGFTVLWTILLWQPLMKFRMNRKVGPGTPPNNMIGETAKVAGAGLKRGETGQVAWSGTLMSAELDKAATADFLPAGTNVVVTSVSGTTLTVIPK